MHPQYRDPRHGSILAATLVTMGVISLVLGSYLSMVATQNRTVVSAYTWNTALPYAEAGIEEALTHLYRSSGTGLAVNGWSADGADWIRTNSIVNGSYQVRISGASTNFTITSTGTAPRISMSGNISRTVRVVANRRTRFPGIVALDFFTISGGATFDSYDSSNPLYSTNGMYTPSKARTNAFIATNSQTNNSVVGGNATIKGNLATGPGGTIQSSSGSALVTGTKKDDFNYAAADVVAPYTSGFAVAAGSDNGTNYTGKLTGGNYYYSGNFSGSLLVTQPSVLYVTGNVGTPLIRIAPGGSLTLYVGGTSFSVSGGNGVVNEGGKPENMTINGLPSVTSISLGGNQSFTGAIYAPNAALTCNATVDFFGALVLKSFNGLGNMEFHFDEALLKGALGEFVINLWDEI